MKKIKSLPTNSRPHNVEVVVKFFYPLMAGIENNVANVYGFLVENGWNVTLHTTRDLPGAKNSLPRHAVFRGIKVHRYSWNWYGYVPGINWDTAEAVCLHNFDIFPHSWILLYVALRRLLHKKTPKIFLTPHGGFTPGWQTFPLWQRLIKKLYQKTLGVWLINNFVDGYRSVSEWEGGESVKNGIRKDLVQVIANGIEDEAYTDVENMASQNIVNRVNQVGKYILQIGRVHPIKNQATVIRALALLPKDINYVIVGPVTDFEYKKTLDRLIADLKLQDRVKFFGVVSGIDKYYVLRKCLAYTHLALWESYCNTVHESMSQGCVCIISKDTAMEELVRDGYSGYVIHMYDHQLLAKRVMHVLQHSGSAEIKSIRQHALDFTSGHSWREISRRVGIMYDRII